MTAGTAALLLALSLAGIAAAEVFLKERKALRRVCVAVLALAAIFFAGYLGLTALFLDAARNQPPTP